MSSMNIAKHLSGKKILITGGKGFIGSHLVERFFENNEITVFDNGRRDALKFLPKEIFKKITVIKGDIRNIKAVKKAVQNKEIVIHLAAIAGASIYEKEPLLTLEVNLLGTANLLNALVNSKVEKVVLFSSSEVYGVQAKDVMESDVTPIGPVSQRRWSYAISKLAGEHLGMAYYSSFNLPVTSVRPFNIYGPRQIGEGAVSKMIIDALTKGSINVTGKGDQKRSWCFITDFVDAIESICLTNESSGESFNLGNPDTSITILELAEKIKKLAPSHITHLSALAAEIYERSPNIQKSRNFLNYKPKVDIEEGLETTFKWFKRNKNRITIH